MFTDVFLSAQYAVQISFIYTHQVLSELYVLMFMSITYAYRDLWQNFMQGKYNSLHNNEASQTFLPLPIISA